MTIPKYSQISCNTKSPYPTKSVTNHKQDVNKTKITETVTVFSLGININTIFTQHNGSDANKFIWKH